MNSQNISSYIAYFILLSIISCTDSAKIHSSPNIIKNFVNNDEELIVDVPDLGLIRGMQSYTLNTRSFIQFLGIQYGIPPSGNERFKPSRLKNDSLSSDPIFNAIQVGPECPQPRRGQEDCLYLNIATPNTTIQNLLPVIVFVHGAAFVEGNANVYLGSRLLKRDVVVVSFNYRLGVFGFFCLNIPNVPCNAGLYDSITALQWVQKYISHFGGNPNLITLVGQSSGSATVSHLILSPLSKGLFHRAMTLSGVALNDWATTTAVNAYIGSLEVAALAGCYTPDPDPEILPNKTGITNCMQNIPQSNITNAQQLYQAIQRRLGNLGFDAVCPTIETQLDPNVPVFLPDHPINILTRQEQNNVPLMIGATKQDGAFGLGLTYISYLVPNGNLQNNSTFLNNELVPTMLSAIGIEDSSGGGVYESIAQIYLGEARNSGNFTQMSPGLIDMSTVFFFKSGIYKTAQLHSRLNSTFLYSFDFKGTQTQHNPAFPFPGGVAHADDLLYLFPIKRFEFNEKEQFISDTMIDYWVNFAISGDPSTFPNGSPVSNQWPEFTEQNSTYLIIDGEIEIHNDYPGKWVGASNDLLNPDPGENTTEPTTIEFETTTESSSSKQILCHAVILLNSLIIILVI